MIAALRPRMLELARDKTRGAHPYLTTPEHTRRARAILGSGPWLCPEQMLILETDPAVARKVARANLETYLRAPNYQESLKELGFAEQDFAGGGSDALVDALVGWGDEQGAARPHRGALEGRRRSRLHPALSPRRQAGHRSARARSAGPGA